MPTEAGHRAKLDASRWQNLQEQFALAVEIPSEARGAFLARLAADEPELAVEVAEMLRAHDTAPLAIEEGVLASEPMGSLVGQRVGPYRILELIGRGGMGDVYLAERDDQYRQRVALKVVRAGVGGRDLRARFRVERQILARLTHASIARLLDGGVTDDGRPYLVMEHIEGVPMTEWCIAKALPISARLHLFLAACRAVEFAHRHLIVHRDLKPSNLLVTAAGEPKLLDFGIAKLLEPEGDLALAPETGTGLGLMTPEHASPEQVRGGPVTTATDVYALGVLLYELLSGRRPHRLGDRSLTDLLRDVCECDPPPPSAVAEPGVRRIIDGDLDAIVLKALRKEPDQRYRSAEQLADDVQRHLDGRPVQARQGSAAYRSARFLRRHTAAVGAASLFVVLLVGFSGVALFQAREVARQRDAARAERDTAEQVVQVLVGLFEASDPTKVPGGDALTVRELLSRSEERVLGQLADQPRVRARVQRALGEMYLARSDLAPAERHLRAALEQHEALGGGGSAEAAAVYHHLALLARRRDRVGAVPMLRRSLAWNARLHGPESARVATVLQDLADALPPNEPREREDLLRRALELRRRVLPPGHPDLAAGLHSLALHHLEGGRNAEAELLLTEARAALEAHRERGPDHPQTLAVMNDLGHIYVRTTRLAQAEAIQRDVLARQTRVFGPDNASVANTLNSLATIQTHRGDLEGAAKSFEGARALHVRRMGPEHWEAANVARNLARVRELQGRYPEALSLMREAYDAARRRDGEGGRMTCVVRGQLGVLLVRTRSRGQGLALLRQAYAELHAMFPSGHAHLADTAIALARALLSSKAASAELAEAERVARRALEIRNAQLTPDHPKLAEARCWLGIVLATSGRDAEARPLLRENLRILEGWGLADPVDVAAARRHLAVAEAGSPQGSDSTPR